MQKWLVEVAVVFKVAPAPAVPPSVSQESDACCIGAESAHCNAFDTINKKLHFYHLIATASARHGSCVNTVFT